jgi:hypothetical protein
MRNRTLFFLCLALPGVVTGQVRDSTVAQRLIEERAAETRILESASSEIRGSRDPDLVPFEWRMFWFLKQYDARAASLSASLSSQEDQALKRAVQSEETARATDNDLYVSSFVSYCGGVDGANAVELARALEALSDDVVERQRSRYTSLLATMSPAARTAIDGQLLDVAKTVSLSTADNVKVATEAPDLFKQHVRGACDAFVNGPPAPPSGSNVSRQTMRTTDGQGAGLSVVSE